MSAKNPLDMSGKKHWERFHSLYDDGGTLGNRYVTAMLGYWNDTDQYILYLSIPKNTDGSGIEKAVQEINQATPLMKKIRFVLFNYHGNEDNSKQLVYDGQEWKLEVLTYGVSKTLVSFADISEMLNHIKYESDEVLINCEEKEDKREK